MSALQRAAFTRGDLVETRVSCTVVETRRTAAGQCSAWNETERVRKIENKSNSQGVFLVYWNSKIASEGGVRGCRRLAFRLVCDLSPPACLPGRTQSVMQEVRLNPGSATHHPPCPWAGHADSLAACRPCKSACRPEPIEPRPLRAVRGSLIRYTARGRNPSVGYSGPVHHSIVHSSLLM